MKYIKEQTVIQITSNATLNLVWAMIGCFCIPRLSALQLGARHGYIFFHSHPFPSYSWWIVVLIHEFLFVVGCAVLSVLLLFVRIHVVVSQIDYVHQLWFEVVTGGCQSKTNRYSLWNLYYQRTLNPSPTAN